MSEQAPTAIVYPVRAEGNSVVHLATATLDEDGAGYSVVCQQEIPTALQLVPADLVFVWCQACGKWADAIGVTLPRSR